MPYNELSGTFNGVGTPQGKPAAYPLANILQDVEKSYDPGKKLLDESEKESNP